MEGSGSSSGWQWEQQFIFKWGTSKMSRGERLQLAWPLVCAGRRAQLTFQCNPINQPPARGRQGVRHSDSIATSSRTTPVDLRVAGGSGH